MAITVKSSFIKVFGAVIALAACKSNFGKSDERATATAQSVMNSSKDRLSATTPVNPKATPPRIAPNTCRIIGQLVSVQPELEPDTTTPCGQVPCKAMVKVLQVLGYGAAFGPPLPNGKEINAYFVFTLSPSETFFPELTNPLPGLKPGHIFQTDIKSIPENSGSSPKWYQVYAYVVK